MLKAWAHVAVTSISIVSTLSASTRHLFACRRLRIAVLGMGLFLPLCAFSQNATTGQIAGVVKDPSQAVVVGTQVTLTNTQTNAKTMATTNSQGVYTFRDLQPGSYVVEVDAKGFKPSISPELNVAAGQTVTSDFALKIPGAQETMTVSANSANAYRVDNVAPGSPLGTLPIVDMPYSVNVISRQLIDDTISRNFKEVAKYLPLIQYQEMQGPEVLRPESRGMQGSNMQNDLKDGMGFAVTTPSALEEYEQIEVLTGLGGAMYGPANPSGMFNFVTKRPTDEQFREIELAYESKSVATAHLDLGGRVGPNHMFGYRTNLVIADGTGYVSDSELRRQLAAIALDVHPAEHTVIQGNFSYYNLFMRGYPGWFAYTPTMTPPSVPGSKSILLPVNAPDPTVRGFGQTFAGPDLNSQISEVRVKQTFGKWQLVLGVLNQLSDRLINTPVTSFIDNNGNYHQYPENVFQNTLAPRFQVKSDLGYLAGSFKTWSVVHNVVIGTNGYKFSTWQPSIPSPTTGTPYALTTLCPEGVKAPCTGNISNPFIAVKPPAGLISYTKTNAQNGIYVNNIIHQQGIVLADTITLTPRWLLRLSADQSWTWVNVYQHNLASHFQTIPSKTGNSSFQGVSPGASVMFKPRPNMTIYGTFVQSIQPPDIAAAASAPAITVNANQVLAAYRSKEGEIGYKLVLRKINFYTDVFRIERPFATYVTNVVSPVCGAQSGTFNCQELEIVGKQINYGAEAMLSGRIIERLMLVGGLLALNPKLTDTGFAATNNKDFVGIPDWQSNILAEYTLPKPTGLFLNFDWRHVGRRAIDDINSAFAPQYNTFDLGFRYTRRIAGKVSNWRVWVNNISDVHYWSTLGPGSITGASTGSYLGHLGDPRLVTASMRMDF